MKKSFIFLFIVACLVVSFSCLTHAEILDFEDLNGLPGGYAALPQGYHGFTWNTPDAAYWVHKDAIPGTGYEYGTFGYTSLASAYANTILMSQSNFILNNLYVTAAWDSQQNVLITGYLNGVQQYQSNVLVNNLSPTFVDLGATTVDSVSFSPNGGEHIVLDNLQYNVVPEPTSYILFGIGLGLVGLVKKFRN